MLDKNVFMSKIADKSTLHFFLKYEGLLYLFYLLFKLIYFRNENNLFYF